MKITWLGHSAFLLEESTGTTVLTDPFDEDKVGYAMKKVDADIISISHNHLNHNYLDAVNNGRECFVVSSIGTYEVQGIHISVLNSYHDNESGAKRGNNLITKFRIDGVDVCHLGDIGEKCSPRIAELIGAVDVLLVPIGGKDTINATQAKEYIDFLMPDVAIPMHYRDEDSIVDADKLDNFIKLFDDELVVENFSSTIELDRSELHGESTKIVIMDKMR